MKSNVFENIAINDRNCMKFLQNDLDVNGLCKAVEDKYCPDKKYNDMAKSYIIEILFECLNESLFLKNPGSQIIDNIETEITKEKNIACGKLYKTSKNIDKNITFTNGTLKDINVTSKTFNMGGEKLHFEICYEKYFFSIGLYDENKKIVGKLSLINNGKEIEKIHYGIHIFLNLQFVRYLVKNLQKIEEKLADIKCYYLISRMPSLFDVNDIGILKNLLDNHSYKKLANSTIVNRDNSAENTHQLEYIFKSSSNMDINAKFFATSENLKITYVKILLEYEKISAEMEIFLKNVKEPTIKNVNKVIPTKNNSLEKFANNNQKMVYTKLMYELLTLIYKQNNIDNIINNCKNTTEDCPNIENIKKKIKIDWFDNIEVTKTNDDSGELTHGTLEQMGSKITMAKVADVVKVSSILKKKGGNNAKKIKIEEKLLNNIMNTCLEKYFDSSFLLNETMYEIGGLCEDLDITICKTDKTFNIKNINVIEKDLYGLGFEFEYIDNFKIKLYQKTTDVKNIIDILTVNGKTISFDHDKVDTNISNTADKQKILNNEYRKYIFTCIYYDLVCFINKIIGNSEDFNKILKTQETINQHMNRKIISNKYLLLLDACIYKSLAPKTQNAIEASEVAKTQFKIDKNNNLEFKVESKYYTVVIPHRKEERNVNNTEIMEKKIFLYSNNGSDEVGSIIYRGDKYIYCCENEAEKKSNVQLLLLKIWDQYININYVEDLYDDKKKYKDEILTDIINILDEFNGSKKIGIERNNEYMEIIKKISEREIINKINKKSWAINCHNIILEDIFDIDFKILYNVFKYHNYSDKNFINKVNNVISEMLLANIASLKEYINTDFKKITNKYPSFEIDCNDEHKKIIKQFEINVSRDNFNLGDKKKYKFAIAFANENGVDYFYLMISNIDEPSIVDAINDKYNGNKNYNMVIAKICNIDTSIETKNVNNVLLIFAMKHSIKYLLDGLNILNNLIVDNLKSLKTSHEIAFSFLTKMNDIKYSYLISEMKKLSIPSINFSADIVTVLIQTYVGNNNFPEFAKHCLGFKMNNQCTEKANDKSHHCINVRDINKNFYEMYIINYILPNDVIKLENLELTTLNENNNVTVVISGKKTNLASIGLTINKGVFKMNEKGVECLNKYCSGNKFLNNTDRLVFTCIFYDFLCYMSKIQKVDTVGSRVAGKKTTLSGGNFSFKNKYLKYKKKYLMLKNSLSLY